MATFRKAARQRIHRRIRKKVAGTAQRPRLAVHFSGKHIYAQVIDDDAGRTIAAASTTESSLLGEAKVHANTAAAEVVGKAIAERSLAKNLDRVVFDRGRFKVLIHESHNLRKAIRLAQARKGIDCKG